MHRGIQRILCSPIPTALLQVLGEALCTGWLPNSGCGIGCRHKSARMELLLGVDGLLAVLLLGLLLEMVVVVAVDPDALPLPAAPLLLLVARAQPSAVLLVPGAQWLAAKCEVVVFDDGGDHPRVAAEVDFAGRGVGDVEVGDQQVGLRGPVVACALWRRHGGCVVVMFCTERVSPSGATIGEWKRPVDVATGHRGDAKQRGDQGPRGPLLKSWRKAEMEALSRGGGKRC